MNLEKLRNSLVLHEGYRRFPYTDTEGHITIGIGHNLENGLTPAIVEAIYRSDVADACIHLGQLCPWVAGIDDVRQRVLTEMMFNLGPAGFAQFKMMIGYALKGWWDDAAREMLDSDWAGQVKGRATRLAEMMRTGKDPGE